MVVGGIPGRGGGSLVEAIRAAPIRACGLMSVFLGSTKVVVMSVAACHPCMSQGRPSASSRLQGTTSGDMDIVDIESTSEEYK